MTGSFAFVLALLPLLSQVSAFGGCDPSIIANIQSSNLTPYPQPKPALFKNQVFSYDYVSASDAALIQSADIVFDDSSDGVVLTSTFNRYLGLSQTQVSTPITFTEKGDVYGVDFVGFIDSATSKNQVYIFGVDDVVVAYYCSLETPVTAAPLFTVNTQVNSCILTDEKVNNIQDIVNGLNNNVAVPLAKLRTPPSSNC